MSFLYPIFLLAGLALAIPVLIHLFNLRRYKTVLFPHTRFLKNIQTHSRKQREVRYKWLLLARMLLVALLVLAFARPFRSGIVPASDVNRLQIIYLDNSRSMSVRQGAQSLLEIAQNHIRQQVNGVQGEAHFLLITNDRSGYQRPVQAEKIPHLLDEINFSPQSQTPEQILAIVQNVVRSENAAGADVYYYSDFQKNTFAALSDTSMPQNVRLYGIPIQTAEVAHLRIDTAWLTTPAPDAERDNELIVKTVVEGATPEETSVLQLEVNGQVKNAVSLQFQEGINERLDTLSFRIHDGDWQQITLAVDDPALRFDDTFRITARANPQRTILVLNQDKPNPYIQAAFHAWQGFSMAQVDMDQLPAELHSYNLIILNGVTRLDAGLATRLSEVLQQGKSVCIFPGRTNNISTLNEGLRMLADIEIIGIDTAIQTVSHLQQRSDLVKDIFERIPEHVQLPTTNWHYIIRAGLTANQQSVMSFRNGSPYLARYTAGEGHLYLCAGAADLFAGNFPGSYFFAPFLYQMGIQSGSELVYAVAAGREQPVFVPLPQTGERGIVHLHGVGTHAIPPQRAAQGGLYVYPDKVAPHPGFYTLTVQQDSIRIALNADRTESELAIWTPAELKKQWPQVNWLQSDQINHLEGHARDTSRFPLWKVCITLALLMLLVETLLLSSRLFRSNAATQ